jgi:hypothetical protein
LEGRFENIPTHKEKCTLLTECVAEGEEVLQLYDGSKDAICKLVPTAQFQQTGLSLECGGGGGTHAE